MTRISTLRRRVAVMLGVLMLASLMLAAPASAATSQWNKPPWSCGSFMVVNSACFTEDAGEGGEELYVVQGVGAAGQVSNLGAVWVTAGDTKCDGGIFNNSKWNDCIDYVRFNIAAGNELCLFQDASFGGALLYTVNGPANTSVNLGGAAHDNVSSISIEAQVGGFC